MLFIGPFDLAAALGNDGTKLPSELPHVQEAINKIRETAHAAGKFTGIFCANGTQARQRFSEGFEFVNIGSEIIGK